MNNDQKGENNILKVLFWNTNKNKDINSILCELIKNNNIDIVVLAEYEANIDDLLERLRKQEIVMKKYITTGADRIKMFGRIENVEPHSQNKNYSIQIVNRNLILCGIHLPSKIYGNSQGRRNIAISTFLCDLNTLEDERGIKNTIVVGDMNENPYECGCLDATNFHGIPSGEDALRETRRIEGKTFKMFYNPMWNLLGDFNNPPGTYYYVGNDTCNTFWHIFDQVMLRPSLREKFVDESLRIISRTPNVSLLDEKNHPNKKVSDHLPIMFEIRE